MSVGGVGLKMSIDSGRYLNIVPVLECEAMITKLVEYVTRKGYKKLNSYGHKEPLNIQGEFRADVFLVDDPGVTKTSHFCCFR